MERIGCDLLGARSSDERSGFGRPGFARKTSDEFGRNGAQRTVSVE